MFEVWGQSVGLPNPLIILILPFSVDNVLYHIKIIGMAIVDDG